MSNYIKSRLAKFLRTIPVVRNHPRFLNGIAKSDKYLLTLTEASKMFSEDQAKSLNLIHKKFKACRVRSHLLPDEWWHDFIRLANLSNTEYNNLSNNIIEKTHSLDAKLLDIHEWIAIYSLCLRVGLFHLGYIFRHLARKRALANIDKNASSQNTLLLRKAYAASLEIGDFEESLIILKHLSKNLGDDSELYLRCSWLFNLFAGENLPNFYDNGKDFCNYLEQKKVAIVGPAKLDNADGNVIDSFDVIVRFNYRKSGIGCDSVYKGMRCNITYFNGAQAINFSKSNEKLFPGELDWIVFRSNHTKKLNSKKIVNNKNRVLNNLNKFFFNGNFNMLPHCILDLLHFSPKSIKVFHSDLMLTISRFNSYYPDDFKRDGINTMVDLFCRGSVNHDPVTQYCTLNNLWQANRIEGDQRFNEVMELGCEEYMRQLQDIYGDHVRLGHRI